MKKTLLSLCFIPLFLSAADFNQGFSGNISLGFGIRDIKSNLSPLADRDYINSINENPHSSTDASMLLGFELYYGGLIDNDRLFLKNYNGRDISGISLGYERAYLEKFTSSFAFISSLREKAYANPYFVKQNREETDVSKFGIKLRTSYEIDALQNVNLSYLFAKNKIDKELIPYNSLKREGYFHQIELKYNYSFFNAGINYDYNDADGKAQSFSRYGVSAGINHPFMQDYILSPEIAFNKIEAKKTNVLYNKKASGNEIKFNLKVVKNNFLDNKNLYSYATYILKKENNDINFYDETYQVFLAGIGYRF